MPLRGIPVANDKTAAIRFEHFVKIARFQCIVIQAITILVIGSDGRSESK